MDRLPGNVTIRVQQTSLCDQETFRVPPAWQSRPTSRRGVTLAMGMQWQMGNTHLDFNDLGLRAAYRPRHAVSKRHQQLRASLAGMDATRTPGPANRQAAASCQSSGLSPVSIRQMLLDRAATLVRLPSRRHDSGQILRCWCAY
jgi:hypothetical protein